MARRSILSQLFRQSAGYVFLLRRTEVCFALPYFAAFFFYFWVKSFWFLKVFSIFAQSAFRQQLHSKAIQNEQNQYKKPKSEIETG